MFHDKEIVRSFHQGIHKHKNQCEACGLIRGACLCPKIERKKSRAKFLLLTHEREMTRTSNTGRLIEDAIGETVTLVWDRTAADELLLAILRDEAYDAYLIFPGDREAEKKRLQPYVKSDKRPLFIIIDATWKEARKILRKSPYLWDLPILDLQVAKKTSYFIRRHSDDHHLCTAEVAGVLLDLIGDAEACNYLNTYYHRFLSLYKEGRENDNQKNL